MLLSLIYGQLSVLNSLLEPKKQSVNLDIENK
jgi:hypothetical protein